MPKSLRSNHTVGTEMEWKYIRNLFFGQKVLDELRILMRLSARPATIAATVTHKPRGREFFN